MNPERAIEVVTKEEHALLNTVSRNRRSHPNPSWPQGRLLDLVNRLLAEVAALRAENAKLLAENERLVKELHEAVEGPQA